ncbi:MAG: hypothetical protein QXT69_04640 [Fervidicoccaceae archaeon]
MSPELYIERAYVMTALSLCAVAISIILLLKSLEMCGFEKFAIGAVAVALGLIAMHVFIAGLATSLS